MKKLFVSLAITMLVASQAFAMSTSKIRETARFLSDRMAWELDMTPQQYDDCYEINYDFIFAINPIMGDVARGYLSAINMYYTYLDWRNEDMRYILNAAQYNRFLQLEYFYRPVYTYRNSWTFRVYQIYNNPKFFYFDAPSIFKIYAGGHSRHHFSDGFYHRDHRYSHKIEPKPHNIHGSHNEKDHQRLDFGNNHREHGAKTPMNGYNNRNQDNREKDSRYQDQRKGQNKNTPQINNRPATRGSNAPAAPNTTKPNNNKPSSTQSGVVKGGAGHSSGGRR
ncbi:MAG: hypothetical protein IKX25_12725 [Bacteroidales bacterium]|nr:hypothetical protein [Bacteroidales bacterium]